jgi:hypothetical protein
MSEQPLSMIDWLKSIDPNGESPFVQRTIGQYEQFNKWAIEFAQRDPQGFERWWQGKD